MTKIKIREKSSKNLVADWFGAHPANSHSHSFLPMTQGLKTYLDHIWPMGQNYHNPVNAFFLMQCLHLSLLNSRPIWFVRDGLIPLLWFFKAHPVPKNINTKIYIEKDFSEYIPDSWRNHFGTYTVMSTDIRPRPKLLIAGLLCDTFLSTDQHTSFFETIKKALDQRESPYEEILTYLPTRFWPTSNGKDQTFHTTILTHVCRTFGCKLKPITQNTFESLENTSDFEYVELNDRDLCADTYYRYLALSRGAKLFFQTQKPSTGNFVSLSPYHGVVLNETLETDSIQNEMSESFQQIKLIQKSMVHIMKSDANLSFPWPQWFAEWASMNKK